MKGLTVLAYHRVHPERRGALCVTSAELERQLRTLIHRGLRPISGQELVRALDAPDATANAPLSATTGTQRWRIPPRFPGSASFLVTFDDGYADFARHAWPVLKRLGVPAVVFLIHDWIGRREPFPWESKYNPRPGSQDLPLDWAEVAGLRAEGCEFGSHTRRHPDLLTLDGEGSHEEIAASRRKLMERLGIEVPLFCYPRGQYSVSLAEEVERSGYRAALLTPRRAGLGEHRFCVRRVGVYAADRGWRYRIKLSPLFDMLREARLRWNPPRRDCCS
ncbi:MAG: polysaccharide deacetylase family protein [Acidobacteriota bacterium]